MESAPLNSLSSLAGLAEGIGKLDPFSNLIDVGASLLGLPPELKSAAKLTAGVATGNPLLIINGALGLTSCVAEHASRGPATELAPRGGCAPACPGYCDSRPPAVPDRPPPGAIGKPPSEQHPAKPPAGQRVPYPLDPDLSGYRDCLQILRANFDTFDTAVGQRDNLFNRDNLAAIRGSSSASAELKRASDFLLQHPEYYNRLEMAAGIGGPDRVVGLPDVNAELSRVEAQLQAHAPPPDLCAPRGGGGLTPGQGYLRDLLSNPELALEDKVDLLLQRAMESNDAEVTGLMAQLTSLQEQKAAARDQKSAAKLDQSIEQLHFRLQRCVERRGQMFQLRSNLSAKFNEMSKVALQNMGRA